MHALYSFPPKLKILDRTPETENKKKAHSKSCYVCSAIYVPDSWQKGAGFCIVSTRSIELQNKSLLMYPIRMTEAAKMQ